MPDMRLEAERAGKRHVRLFQSLDAACTGDGRGSACCCLYGAWTHATDGNVLSYRNEESHPKLEWLSSITERRPQYPCKVILNPRGLALKLFTGILSLLMQTPRSSGIISTPLTATMLRLQVNRRTYRLRLSAY